MCNKVVENNYLPSNLEYILGINDNIVTGLIYSIKNENVTKFLI